MLLVVIHGFRVLLVVLECYWWFQSVIGGVKNRYDVLLVVLMCYCWLTVYGYRKLFMVLLLHGFTV